MTFPFNEYFRNDLDKQMARRMDRKVIKLEAAFGSERQFVLVRRNQDLIVHDLMEEVQKIFKIPINEQVIFHKGTNLCDFMNEKLEALGIENNNQIRITRDSELPKRSPRPQQQLAKSQPTNAAYQQPQIYPSYQNGPNNMNNHQNGLDPLSYLKEISPQRVPDPTPYQVQVYNQSKNNPAQMKPGSNDVLKLYVSFGSEREYILVHGKKPLMILDLKMQISRQFKIPPEQQCIVFRGYNLHEYLDDAPLEAFGLENNSPIAVWPKGNNNRPDLRLPRGSTPPPGPDLNSPRMAHPPQKWMGGSNEPPSEVIKVEVQHGSDRHQVILKGQQKTVTVQDLQNELERITAVPVKDQRLFFKSQELHNTPYKTLKECELENNHVVKLVGEPSKLRYSNYFGRLMPVVNNSTNNSNSNNNNFNNQQMPNMNNQYQNYNNQYQQQAQYQQYPPNNNSQQGFYQQPYPQQGYPQNYGPI